MHRVLAVLIFASGAMVPGLAPAAPNTRVQGTLFTYESGGFFAKLALACTGTPTCTGIYNFLFHHSDQCPDLSILDTVVITDLNLDQPGVIRGIITYKNFINSFSVAEAPPYCLGISSRLDVDAPYAATWDGSTGTFDSGGGGADAGTFTASSAAPVFPMTVIGSVTPTVSNISAQFQPRPQDVGTTASVFVFAHAPASAVRKSVSKQAPPGDSIAIELEDADFCVLAQLNSSGQLAGVTASTMQAYSTGVLTSSGQAVAVLDNVSTPTIAGATFYVGYGANASAMLGNAVYQNAVSVPGASQCTASLATSPVANSPGALSGLWYNAAESGWGVYFTQRREILFAAWYTYDSAGNPKWYVASSCAMPTGTTGTSGTCNGTLYEVTGPVFFGGSFNSALVNVRMAGSLQVNFQNANNASMTYTANGLTRTVAITRQVFQTGTTTPAIDYTDLWFNAAESGWGMAVSHQFGVMFLAWYVYDNTGKPVWYVASNCVVSGSGCTGTLYRTTGPPLGPTFNPAQVQAFSAGTASITFTDANNGVLTYTVNGINATKVITRQVF